MTESAFLSVRDLSCMVGNSTRLVEAVSFDLEEGAILAIVGPNGAGKTTLLHLLCGLQGSTAGEVWLQGDRLRRLSARERARRMAVVGQQEQPDGRLTLRDYVALGQVPIWTDHSAAVHAAALERVLKRTGLQSKAHQLMARLSGGERQRAHIARALAQQPSLLFLDEPTNHLDPDAKGRVLSLVVELDITVVLVVHDLVMVPTFATHVALMKSARMTGFGPVDQVLTPARVRETFGVDYLRFHHEGRVIPALDIRKTRGSL